MPKKTVTITLTGPMDVLRERGPSTGNRYEFLRTIPLEVAEEDFKPLTRAWAESQSQLRPEYQVEEGTSEAQSAAVPLADDNKTISPGG